MANLKEVRNRIASVGSTMQITMAMKMVSASKLRKSQNAVLALRPYSNMLSDIISNIMDGDDTQIESPYCQERKIDSVLLLVLTSNKGLCGGFNTNIIKRTRQRVKEIYQEDKYIKVDVMTFGRKGSEFFSKDKDVTYVKNIDSIWDNLCFEDVAKISNEVMSLFKEGLYDRVEIIYNRFKNSATQILTTETFLPIGSLENKEEVQKNNNYIFEPTKTEIITNIIPQKLNIQMFSAFLDSMAAENGARMTAMHKATDNAQELLKELKLSYNKARQAAITNEIIEICSGAEALNG